MTPLQKKYEGLTNVQIDGMINYCIAQNPYLEFTSVDVLRLLIMCMIKLDFMFDVKATPIKSSYVFLQEAMNMEAQAQGQAIAGAEMIFAERDFVFAIKLFDLYLRVHNGVIQFVPDDEQSAGDEIVPLENRANAMALIFYLSGGPAGTKIQLHSIESATNRLRRDFREIELAKLFGSLIKSGMKVGDARATLRNEYGVEDHQFVRVREHAVQRGLFISKRREANGNRRVTLDDDVYLLVENLSHVLTKKSKPLTMSATVNQVLKDFAKSQNIPIPVPPPAEPKKARTTAARKPKEAAPAPKVADAPKKSARKPAPPVKASKVAAKPAPAKSKGPGKAPARKGK